MPYQTPGLRRRRRRAGPIRRSRTESVPQIPARPCAESAPTGSSRYFSIRITPTTTITPAIRPMIGAAQYSTYPQAAVIATRPAIAPLPAMPTSSVRSSASTVIEAPITPAAAPSWVFSATSAKNTPSVARVEPGVEPEPADPEDHHPEPDQRHRVARDRPGLAVRAVLALAGAQQQQRREAGGGTGQVDHRGAREVQHLLAADVVQQPEARPDRVGDRSGRSARRRRSRRSRRR